MESAIEPGVEIRWYRHHQVGDAHQYGRRGHDQGRDEDGEGYAGDGERHDDQGGGDRAAPAMASLLLEEVDQRQGAAAFLVRASW
jgi:hypothetical protein